jgi:hypothetical protein
MPQATRQRFHLSGGTELSFITAYGRLSRDRTLTESGAIRRTPRNDSNLFTVQNRRGCDAEYVAISVGVARAALTQARWTDGVWRARNDSNVRPSDS